MPLLKLFESGSIYLQENISIWLLLLLVGGGAKEEQQRLNLSGTLCRPSIRPITIFHRFFLFYSIQNLVTDQRSVSFMLDLKHSSKIKNDKIQRWRLELASFDFTTIYRSGSLNSAPDIFSRSNAASASLPSLNINRASSIVVPSWHYQVGSLC